jgi:hypothetical protein
MLTTMMTLKITLTSPVLGVFAVFTAIAHALEALNVRTAELI